ncbi:hypothetical protein [Streptomyces sp. NPDC001296]
MARLSSIHLVAGVAVHGPYLAEDGLELLQGDRDLAQFGAAGACLFAGGSGGAGEGVGEGVELGRCSAVVAAEEADRCLFHAQVEQLAIVGAERQGSRLDNVAEQAEGAGAGSVG